MPRPSNPEPTVRKSIALAKRLWKAVNEYRFARQIHSEAEAIRCLIERGLQRAADDAQSTALTVPGTAVEPLSQDTVKDIALDIGKEVASHIEVMYPAAVTAASSTFLLSVRNTVYNEIMAALEMIDEEAIRRRLDERKRFRRKHRAAYRRLRNQPITEDVVSCE